MTKESMDFKASIIKIAIPIMLSRLITSSISFVDNIMIGNLGEIAIAGVSLANEFSFIFMILIYGISAGASIFITQYWGRKDIKSIHSFMGICYRLAIPIAVIFFIGARFFPRILLSFYSKDINLINTGSEYLKVISYTFLISVISIIISNTLRSTGKIKTPLVISTIAILINSILNLLLIYGIGFFPKLGVTGAAIATLISRLFETILLLYFSYYKRTAAATPFKDILVIPKNYWFKYFKTSVPVIFNDFGWAAGMTICISIYSRMGLESITAYKISAVIMDLFFVAITSSASASAIILGNIIGTGNTNKARIYSVSFLKLSVTLTLILGVIVASLSSVLPEMFNVSDSVKYNSKIILLIFSVFLIIKGVNNHLIIGFFRSGGDTLFSMLLNTLGIWFWAVPAGFISGLYFNLPVYIVFGIICLEEVFKLILGLFRFKSGKWIREIINT